MLILENFNPFFVSFVDYWALIIWIEMKRQLFNQFSLIQVNLIEIIYKLIYYIEPQFSRNIFIFREQVGD